MTKLRPISWRLVCALAAVAVPCRVAVALPMQPEDCERARSEHLELSAAGVAADVARGADWGRSNLSEDGLKKVSRWIELEEQILFRCPRPKPVPAAAGGNGPAADTPGGGAGQKANTSGSKKPEAPAAKKKPASAASEAKADAEPLVVERGAPVPAKPKPPTTAGVAKPKPAKPKVDDAYIPPAPFSGQEYHNPAPGPAGSETGSALAP